MYGGVLVLSMIFVWDVTYSLDVVCMYDEVCFLGGAYIVSVAGLFCKRIFLAFSCLIFGIC